jgi:glucose/arabinose dehydrogenase
MNKRVLNCLTCFILIGMIGCTGNSPATVKPLAPIVTTETAASEPKTTLPVATQVSTPIIEETPSPAFEPRVGLSLLAQGFSAPVALIPDGKISGRRFIVDQVGLIWTLTTQGEVISQPFLDLRDKMVNLNTSYDERGLLGLAFHPNYHENGRFFVYYSAPLRNGAPGGWDHTSHISEFRVSSENPDAADLATERILLQVDQPQSNHNAGQLAFGPDGTLYIALGDGGAANDVGLGHTTNLGNGQDTSTLLGSILRIDVDSGDPYGIPDDNPWLGKEGQAEIFAYGLRNPYRFSFDAGGSNQLFAGDVGQNRWEEINIVSLGNNYGWNVREGTHCFDPQNPNIAPDVCSMSGSHSEALIDPILEYLNANAPGGIGLSVIGGFVYRGTALPQFQGRYIFGDWSTNFSQGDGTLFIATPPSIEGARWVFEELQIDNLPNGRLGSYLLSIGQDAELEIYLLTSNSLGPTGNTGRIWKITQPSEVNE